MTKTEHWRKFSTNSGRLTAGWLPLLWPCRVVDAGAPFVKATYSLEEDGLLVFQTYSTCKLWPLLLLNTTTLVAAQAPALGETPEEVASLTAFAREGVQPGITYFLQKFNGDFYNVVRAFRAARMACPMTAQELQPTVQDVEQLKMFPCLDDNTITWLEFYRRSSWPTSLKSRSAPRRRDGVAEAPQTEPTTLVVCCIQFSFGSAIKCSSRASVLHPSLTLWRPPSWSTWGLFGGHRDACIQLSWLTYRTRLYTCLMRRWTHLRGRACNLSPSHCQHCSYVL